MAIVEKRRLISREEKKKKDEKEGGAGGGAVVLGVVKVGDVIPRLRGNAHATGRCVLRQPVNILCTFPCNVLSKFYATFPNAYFGKL